MGALIEACHAIYSAGNDIWEHPQDFCTVFSEALHCAGTSSEQIGISVFIFMRADEWISRSATITSPVMPLQDAVVVHARLLAARKTSWAHLRAQWVQLMLQTQHARFQRLSQAQAEAIAEKARLPHLEKQLRHAVAAAEHAMKLRRQLRNKVRRKEARLQRQADKVKKATMKRLAQ